MCLNKYNYKISLLYKMMLFFLLSMPERNAFAKKRLFIILYIYRFTPCTDDIYL